MNNLRSKTEYVKSKQKNYMERFSKVNIGSYTKDGKIHIGCKPTELYSLFNGNTSSIKKSMKNDIQAQKPDDMQALAAKQHDIVIDQSTLQYYIILGMQDMYYNYLLPLQNENKTLKDIFEKHKKKCNSRFDFLITKL